MRADGVAKAAVAVFYLLIVSSNSAYGRKGTSKGCVRWRFDQDRSQWRYRCDGGRVVLHEEDLILVDWKTGKLKVQNPPEPGLDLECTCDDPGSTFGYTCPNVNGCPKHYRANEFLQMESAVKKAAYNHEYHATGFGALALRYYPGRILIPDVIARQIEKGECTLQCGSKQNHCGKKCPNNGEPKSWVCHYSEGLYQTTKTFSAKEYHDIRRGLKHGSVAKEWDVVTIELHGAVYEIDVDSANAVASNSCEPICETVSIGTCKKVPCKEYGISHYTCGDRKLSVPQFLQLASMLSKSTPRKVSDSLSNPIYELSDGGHKGAVLVEESVMELAIESRCEPTCKEPPSSTSGCAAACDASSIQEYVCEVENDWLHNNTCESPGGNGSLFESRKDHQKDEGSSSHHLSKPAFNELLLATKSGTCKFVEHPGFPEFSTYSCYGGKVKIPPELFVALIKQKCAPVCQQEELSCVKRVCESPAPMTCEINDHAVQIHSYLAEELSYWVKHELCELVSKHSYGKDDDDLWICPGGTYIAGDTYRSVHLGDCTDGCSQKDLDCQCGDIEPAAHFYSGVAAIKNNVPIAGRTADFLLQSTHPLLPLSSSSFEVTGPQSYDVYSTPGFDPTLQYVTVEILESYNGPVEVKLNEHARDKFGSSVCNVDEVYMKYYAKQCFPIQYKSIWVEQKGKEEQKEPSGISFDSTKAFAKIGNHKKRHMPVRGPLSYVSDIGKASGLL